MLTRRLFSLVLLTHLLLIGSRSDSSYASLNQTELPFYYGLRAYSFYQTYTGGTHVEVKTAKLDSSEGKPIPLDSDQTAPFEVGISEPEQYWSTHRIYLSDCRTLGQSWMEYFYGIQKKPWHSGNAVTINNQQVSSDARDLFYCDNNYLYLTENGIILDHKNLRLHDPQTTVDLSPAFITWSPVFPDHIYLARAGKIYLLMVQGSQLKFINAFNQLTDREILNAAFSPPSRFFPQGRFISKHSYQAYLAPQEAFPLHVFAQTGLAIHLDPEGNPLLISSLNNPYPAEFPGTFRKSIIRQMKLEEETGDIQPGSHTHPLSGYFDAIDLMFIPEKDENPLPDLAMEGGSKSHLTPRRLESGSPYVYAGYFGKHTTSGEVSQIFSNGLRYYHKQLTGDHSTTRNDDVLIARTVNGHSLVLQSPTIKPEKVKHIIPKIPILTRYIEDPDNALRITYNPRGSRKQTVLEDGTPLIRQVSRQYHGDYQRQKTANASIEIARLSNEHRLIDHLGRVINLEAGRSRASTFLLGIDSSTDEHRLPAYEVYVSRTIEGSPELLLRIPMPSKNHRYYTNYYQGLSLFPVWNHSLQH